MIGYKPRINTKDDERNMRLYLKKSFKDKLVILQWETLFSKVANTVDNLPMAKRNTSNATNLGYEIITPNRLKLGRNNFRTLDGSGIKLDMAANLTAMLERNR